MIFNLFRKSNDVIDSSQKLAEYLGAGYSSHSGVSVTPKNALKLSAVYSCIRVLAESTGMLPLRLYKREGESAHKAADHGLYRLLHVAPNDYMTAQEFKEMCVAHLMLRGNFYAWKNVVNGQVRELLPLQPDAVTVKQRENYDVVYTVRFLNGKESVLTSDDIFHVKLFSVDGLTGLSPVQQARETIGLAMATEEHGARLFSNGAKPGGVLSTDQVLKDESFDRIKASWNSAHEGVSNAHKVAILEGGLKWTQVGMSSEDSQFLQTRNFQRSEIAGIYRVPPHMIGDLKDATFSNIEQQSLDFVTNSLMPLLTRIEQRVNFSLLGFKEQSKYYAKFTVNSLLRGDMSSRSEFYTKMVQNGAMSPNEIRALEDMNPRTGGDIYLTPLNMAINGKTPKDSK